METIKANLDGTININENAVYLVDFSRMQKVEDLIIVLQAVGFSFSPKHPQFQNIQHLLDLNRPIEIGSPQPKQQEIKLPKLKRVD